MKILVISLAGIGDTLFATPLIHELRANFPKAVIDALVLWPGARDALAGNPHLDAIHQKNLIKAGKVEALRFLWGLRKNKYDISINTHPQSRTQYRAVARLIGARLRASHSYDRSNFLDRALVNHLVPQDYQRHSIENNLALLSLIGVRPMLPTHNYEMYLSPAEDAWASQYVGAHGLKGRRVLGIHVGSGGTKNLALRRWPVESYIELIQRLVQARPDLSVLLFGGPEEEADNQHILAFTGSESVSQPKTSSLRQAAALARHCHAFLSVDTALMHVAAAMKVPAQVVIETPTWNKPIEPYNRPFMLVPNPRVAGRNLQYYRYDGRAIQGTRKEIERCMASVTVNAVFETVTRALERQEKAAEK